MTDYAKLDFLQLSSEVACWGTLAFVSVALLPPPVCLAHSIWIRPVHGRISLRLHLPADPCSAGTLSSNLLAIL